MNFKISNHYEFIKLIESIGFRSNGVLFVYKNFIISIGDIYHFWNGFVWILNYQYSDLKPIEKYFKKELRSIKLKQLLK